MDTRSITLASILFILIIGSTSTVYGQILNPVTVSTDKLSYTEGEKIVITGSVAERLDNYYVSLVVISPNGEGVAVDQMRVDNYNRFQTEITAGGIMNEEGTGTYTIKVLYATLNRTAETSFQYFTSGTTLQPSVTISTDKSTYKANEKINVKYVISNRIPNEKLTITLYNPNDQFVLSLGIPDSYLSTHLSSYTTIPSNQGMGVGGAYSIIAEYGSSKSIQTLVVSSPFEKEHLNGDEYVPINYSFDFTKKPLIGISFGENDFEQSQLLVSSVKTGIEMWTVPLKQKFGGDWSVDYVMITPQNRLQVKPDIIFNMETKESHEKCSKHGGWAVNHRDYNSPDTYKPRIPINVYQCFTPEFYNDPKYFSILLTMPSAPTTAHEFFHALGFMHVYNKELDFMCGFKLKKYSCTQPEGGYTSDDWGIKNAVSDFDLTAIAYLYGVDGFQNPNRPVFGDPKFTAYDYLNFDVNEKLPTFEDSIDSKTEIKLLQELLDLRQEFLEAIDIEKKKSLIDSLNDTVKKIQDLTYTKSSQLDTASPFDRVKDNPLAIKIIKAMEAQKASLVG